MKITTVLFDLDGTLLPMDQDVFVKSYFKLLAAKLSAHGYEPNQLIDSVWAGTAAMIKNDGNRKNEEAFWDKFTEIYGKQSLSDIPLFEEFYGNDFQNAKTSCGFNPKAAKAVAEIKKMGLRTALATNPIFPAIATESRIRWAGLKPEDFEIYTTYENIGYSKPNPKYYEEILNCLNVKAEECLMVGNDVSEDMVAETLGIQVFLLTDCIINKNNKDISGYNRGNFDELIEFIKNNIS